MLKFYIELSSTRVTEILRQYLEFSVNGLDFFLNIRLPCISKGILPETD
jgi:hypothetical protein